MRRYVLTREAQEDVRAIRQYLLQEAGFRVTRHVLARFGAAFRALSRSPEMGHRREGPHHTRSPLFG